MSWNSTASLSATEHSTFSWPLGTLRDPHTTEVVQYLRERASQ